MAKKTAEKTLRDELTEVRDALDAIIDKLNDESAAPAPAAKGGKTSTKSKKPEPVDENTDDEDEGDEIDLEEMSFKELKAFAKENGIDASGSRAELEQRIYDAMSDDEDDEDEDNDEDDSDDEDEPSVQEQVEAATADMDLDDLAEFCRENGLSPKGKRNALIARIVKAVEDGDIELSDEDEDDEDEEDEPPVKKNTKSGKSSKKVTEPEDDDEDDDDEAEETPAHKKAVAKHEKDTRASFKKGELERGDLVEFLCDFYDKKSSTYKKASDAEILNMYIEASSKLINDEGKFVEEGAYTVNGVPYCCGRPLDYNEDDEQFVCSHCGETYDADEDE